jgi:hypothetical protein
LQSAHRKGWRYAFEDLLVHCQPEGLEDGWKLDEEGMTLVSTNASEWPIARGQIQARGGLRENNGYPFAKLRESQVLTQVRQALAGAAELKLHAENCMEDFVDPCDDLRLGRALAQALEQRKPFRRFKDTRAENPVQREAWFAFERQAMEKIARRRCEDHGIAPTWVADRQLPSS